MTALMKQAPTPSWDQKALSLFLIGKHGCRLAQLQPVANVTVSDCTYYISQPQDSYFSFSQRSVPHISEPLDSAAEILLSEMASNNVI